MRIIGHRGARGYEPENTLCSIGRAIDMGVDMVEFDIQLSKEGIPVLIHDETVDRTTNGMGRVADLTLAQLQRFDAGKGERIPTLAQAIDFIDRRVPMNIELKGIGSWRYVADELRSRIDQGWRREEFTVSSFSWNEIRRFHRSMPNTPIAFLYEKRTPYLAATILVEASAMNPSLDLVTEMAVCRAHGADLQVNVFTVNEERDFARMRDLNVDGIFTDYPDRALRYFGR